MEWTAGKPNALLVAVRSERPMGAFQGAMTAILPLAALQPDIRDPALPLGAQAAVIETLSLNGASDGAVATL
ncbi:hypothetical protein LTR94_037574, partial [Friedmanniomyces endolithicus]